MPLERGRPIDAIYGTTGHQPEELLPHEQAQLQVEGNPRWAIGSWAQTIRHMLGRDASSVVITAEQPVPSEFSSENAIYNHLLGVRDNYAHISTQRRGTRDYLDLDDTELRACIPSYQMLSVELEQAHGGADLLEMGNTRIVLSQQGKDLAAQLVENFMTQIKGSEEYDLPSLFSHQLKLMYVGLKHDPDHTDINTNVMQRIFTSARAQFRRRMAEEARAQAHAQAVAEEAAQRAREAAATATRSRPSRLRRGLELAGAGSLMTVGLALIAQAGMIWAEGVANRLPVKPPREPQPITRSVDAYGNEIYRYARPIAFPSPTTDTRLDDHNVEVGELGSEDPLARMLPQGALKSSEHFSMTFFDGTEHSTTMQTFIERRFASWDEFVAYVLEKKDKGERWSPEFLDGLLVVPVNGGEVINGHSRNGQQNGPFTPIQDAYKQGIDPTGMVIPITAEGGSIMYVRVASFEALGPDPDGGPHPASPANFQTWVTQPGQVYGTTCLADLPSDGDYETDVYGKFRLERANGPVSHSALGTSAATVH